MAFLEVLFTVPGVKRKKDERLPEAFEDTSHTMTPVEAGGSQLKKLKLHGPQGILLSNALFICQNLTQDLSITSSCQRN